LDFHPNPGNMNPLDSNAIDLYVDGVAIVEDHDSMDPSLAVSCLMAAYFVYGIEYADNVKNTLMFLQKFIFGLDEKGQNPKKLQTALRAYNMLI
jgi:hypothetical protein